MCSRRLRPPSWPGAVDGVGGRLPGPVPARAAGRTPVGLAQDQARTRVSPRVERAVGRARAVGIDPCRLARERGVQVMDMKLELVVVPVSDVDRAKHFY